MFNQVSYDNILLDIKAEGETKESILLINREMPDFSGSIPVLVAQELGEINKFPAQILITPLRPLHPAKQGCVEHYFGALLEKFPELKSISDEEADKILDRMRGKRISDE